MIVTCPSCSARYKINESKIKGRGAKITCPRCGHRFVVYRNKGKKVPDNVGTLDFRTLGITWRVRKGEGVTYEFPDLATLKEFLRDGQVDTWDQITYDNRSWSSVDSHPSLEEFFWDIWQKARRGEVDVAPPDDVDDEEEDDEDDSDAPTTIVGRGSSLASELRMAVSEAATPTPAEPRAQEEDHEGVLVDAEETLSDATPPPAPEALPQVTPPPTEDEDEDDMSPTVMAPITTPDPPAPLPTPDAPKEEPPQAPAQAKAKAAQEEPGAPVGLVIAGVILLVVLVGGGLWSAGLIGGASGAAPVHSTPGGE